MNTTIRKPHPGSNISDPYSEPEKFISRELSWLEFNARVLEEAEYAGNLPLDKLKFAAIFSSNLDEFFMIRVAALRQLIAEKNTKCDPAGNTPEDQWKMARKKICAMLKKQYKLLNDEILPQLNEYGIFFRRFDELVPEQQKKMRKFFSNEILPALTPRAIDPNLPFPLINSGNIELAVKLFFKKSEKNITALVEVPELLDRFIPFAVNDENKQEFILIEELISANIDLLFPGSTVTATQLFRLTRDMNYSVDIDDSGDLIHELLNELSQCSRRSPVRLEFSTRLSNKALQKYLANSLNLKEDFCFFLPGFLDLRKFSSLDNFISNAAEMREAPWQPLLPEIFSGKTPVFEIIAREKNILLTHPYQSFDPILRLLEEAAADPDVVAIKQTLYRVSGDSPVVKALRKAAENGKQVTVLVELKARFDESNNIAWAELLDLSGAHVIYGVPGLKVHGKALLIVRKEKGRLRRYIHFGTGNYNDRTAKQYTDFSLLSCDKSLAEDAAELFNLLTGNFEPPEKWNSISVAPFNLRKNLLQMIENEIAIGKKGHIIAKMNSFSDPELIRMIHRAADAGVKIDLIVRGICCLRPQKNHKNLRIISIVDRYLEHARVFYFGSSGKLYLSSADWMPRNLDRRIEVMFPVKDENLKNEILTIVNCQLNDHAKQRRLLPSGNYTKPGKNPENRSQKAIYDFLKTRKKISE